MYPYLFSKLFFAAFAVISVKPCMSKDNFIISYSENSGLDWWQAATFYQIYPSSFKDSDNDGIGDIKGIIEKLDYIEELGVTAIWLSPIFKSPQVDQGYDISDFRDVDPIYGTFDDFLELIQKAHDRSIKLVIDFVPNHTSDQHEWFQKSVNGTEGYEDYYIWANGTVDVNGTHVPPNNWLSVFKYSAWTWNDQRQQFYFHQFLKEQPDLNYRNEKVVQEMKDILSFWLDTHNVDGVRIDAIPHLFEASNLTDEPRTNDPSATDIDYNYLNHIFTTNQPETFEEVYEWRTFLDNMTISKNASTRIFMTEAASPIDSLVKYYGNSDGSVKGAHFSFNFNFLGLIKQSTAEDIIGHIQEWFDKLPKIYTYNWLLGNHDNHRIASKVGVEKVDGLNMLTAYLPGIQISYNGEEIGMENGNVTCEEGQDGSAIKDNCTHYESSSRDFERTPFQWDNSTNAGFNAGNKTWLPVSSKYKECNVADQLAQNKSHLKIYKQLQKLRPNLTMLDTTELHRLENNSYVLKISRYNKVQSASGQDNTSTIWYDYVFNIGSEAVVFNITEAKYPNYEVVISSGNSEWNTGDHINGKNFTIQPYECLILKKLNSGSAQSTIGSTSIYLFVILSNLYLIFA